MEIDDCWTRIHECTNFFRSSSSRKDELKKPLHQLCDTRWVERHDAVARFAEIYPDVVDVLKEITYSQTWPSSTRGKASLLLNVNLTILCSTFLSLIYFHVVFISGDQLQFVFGFLGDT